MKICDWYYGKSGFPDLSLCPKCPHKSYCKGRKYVKGKHLSQEKIKKLIKLIRES